MDVSSLLVYVVLGAVLLLCSVLGIKYFIKYKKERKNTYLALSLILGLVPVAGLLLVLSILSSY